MNTHVRFAFPLYLKQVQLDESRKEKNISSGIYSVLNDTENTLLFFMLFCLSFPASRGVKIVK